jgi:hypothetical protein
MSFFVAPISCALRVQAGSDEMKAYWAIGMVMAAGLRAQVQGCSVYVYVETNIAMPVGMVLDAKTKATQMFHEIGVNVKMRNGIPANDPRDACGAPIVVQFENAAGYRGSEGALAYARPFRASGTCIHLFVDRVLAKLDHEASFSNALMTHVMVHEITHVLEQIDRHSAEGVMKAVWSESDYRSMRRHPLPFAPEDVELIRMGIAKRIALAKAE